MLKMCLVKNLFRVMHFLLIKHKHQYEVQCRFKCGFKCRFQCWINSSKMLYDKKIHVSVGSFMSWGYLAAKLLNIIMMNTWA